MSIEPSSTSLPAPPADDSLLADLTEAQRQAVTHTEGPLLVLAAAGSGKTRVITRRAAYLVRQVGIPPWQVLSLTFTNKAAGEMRERIGSLVNERQARAMTICTFHALCAKLLRQYADEAELKADFVIYDSADQKKAIKDVFKELDLSTSHFTPDTILSTISNAKNQLMKASDYSAEAGDFYTNTVARVYKAYEAKLDRAGAVDFDDLLMRTARLLRHHERVRTELQERFGYVQVDEYQDTNHAQFVIAHTLCAGHRNLCVVGDPDQSIYAWRGADIRNILEFETHYTDAVTIALGQNYRSTPQVLLAADTLIRRNRRRRHKDLYTTNPDGSKVRVIRCDDEEHEAQCIVDFLRARRGAGRPWSDMAIFYRVNALSRVLEDAMMRSAIPYQIARGTAFYQRKEIKDAMAYLRVAANADDEVNLTRIINTPTRGIGDTTVKRLQAEAAAHGLSLWAMLAEAASVDGLTARATNAVARFAKMIDDWRQKLRGEDAPGTMFASVNTIRELVELVLHDSGLEAYYKADKTGDEEKLANLYELVSAAQRFDDEYGEEDAPPLKRLHDYLEAVSLVADIDALDQAVSDDGMVTLMTLHTAKGLEFDSVAMADLEEGLPPHSRSFDDPDGLEEERRLCFVGITPCSERTDSHARRYRTIRGVHQRAIPESVSSGTRPRSGRSPRSDLRLDGHLARSLGASTTGPTPNRRPRFNA